MNAKCSRREARKQMNAHSGVFVPHRPCHSVGKTLQIRSHSASTANTCQYVPICANRESRECLACTGSRLAQRTMTLPYIAVCSRGRIRTTRPVRQDAGESHHAREQPLQSGLWTTKKLCFGAPQVAHLSGLVEDGVVACTSRPLHMPAKRLGRTPATQSYARMHTFLALA